MKRAVGAILIVAAASGCKKGGGGAKPIMERELVHAAPVVSKLQLDIALPKGIAGGAKDAASAHWTEAASGANPALDVDVATGKAPVAMQNAVNAAASDSLTVTRTDELPDGWLVSGNTADGATTKVSRQIKVSDTAAVVCTTSVTWAKPEAKNVEWAESFCKSLVVKPQ